MHWTNFLWLIFHLNISSADIGIEGKYGIFLFCHNISVYLSHILWILLVHCQIHCKHEIFIFHQSFNVEKQNLPDDNKTLKSELTALDRKLRLEFVPLMPENIEKGIVGKPTRNFRITIDLVPYPRDWQRRQPSRRPAILTPRGFRVNTYL